MTSFLIATPPSPMPAPTRVRDVAETRVKATRGLSLLAAVLSIIVTFVLLFAKSMRDELDHDEHQFIASAVLLGRRGMLPYRDFPYFHMPYLVYVDAAIFRLTPYLLLSARAFSTMCGAATIVLVSVGIFRAVPGPPLQRWGAAIVGGVILMTQPIFFQTSGVSWNHDLSEALLIGSILLILRGISNGFTLFALFISGTLMGLAIGVRLTVAPAALAGAVMIAAEGQFACRPAFPRVGTTVEQYAHLASKPGRARAFALAFVVGTTIALVPAFLCLISWPAAFLFGNLRYPALNTAWWLASGRANAKNATIIGKVLYLFTHILNTPAGIALAAGVAWAAITLLRHRRSGYPRRGKAELSQRVGAAPDSAVGYRQSRFLAVMLLFTSIGAFAPAPAYVQYFFGPTAIAVLFVGVAISPFIDRLKDYHFAKKLAMLAVILVGAMPGMSAYTRSIPLLFRPAQWVPVRVHQLGIDLRRAQRGDGPVLTLAPIIPLEGGLDIYETYAAAPFTARVAPMVTQPERESFKLADDRMWRTILAARPPGSILVGNEGGLEEPLLARSRASSCPIFQLSKDAIRPILNGTRGAGQAANRD